MAYVETGNATQACRQVYDHNGNDATAGRGAHDVMYRPTVEAYVAELQAEHRVWHNVTVDRLTEELETARQLALKNKKPSAAVSATIGKARLQAVENERLIDPIESHS